MQAIASNWSVAIFAHNEAANLAACVDSLYRQTRPAAFAVYVLANGCTDKTLDVAHALAASHPGLRVIELAQADKAAAWNHYVHELAGPADSHFFIDADVTAQPGALALLYDAQRRHPLANALAAVPANGRTRAAWIRRMQLHGRVSGGLYALRGEFVERLRQQGIRLPTGLIGEDFLVSALAKDMPGAGSIITPGPGVWIETGAGFRFRPLRKLNPAHVLAYARRLIRYRVRGHQLAMLFSQQDWHGFHDLPSDMRSLYAHTPHLPTYQWRGRDTLLDAIAVYQMRREARLARAADT